MTRELYATLGDREVEVEVVERRNGHWVLRIDGREVAVDTVKLGPDTYSLLLDGRSILVDIATESGRDVVRTGTVEQPATIIDARRKRLSAVAKRGPDVAKVGGAILAPIAGKVVKMLVAIGDPVQVGEPVAVLEAMKMENEIKAERSGVVTTVHVKAGDSLETRQKLVTVE